LSSGCCRVSPCWTQKLCKAVAYFSRILFSGDLDRKWIWLTCCNWFQSECCARLQFEFHSWCSVAGRARCEISLLS
jgi:hypothetical protein